MPCWTIQESRAEFGATTDRSLFAKAMESLGYRTRTVDGVVHFSSEAKQSGGRLELNGTLVMQGGDQEVNPFKRAYSAEVVKAASARFGWKVQQKSETEFQVTRRA